MKPRALDLFSGAGGAARGLQLAGFHVTGVDIKPQPRYAGDVFVQADAMEFPLEGFDFIWASPPCQGYSRLRHLPWLKGKTWPKLVGNVREKLNATGVPWCIENVPDAPLHGFILCGRMFGLPVYRHRRFETSHLIMVPEHRRHDVVIGHGRMLNDRGKGGRGEPCQFCGYRFDQDALGKYGCPNCNGEGLDDAPPAPKKGTLNAGSRKGAWGTSAIVTVAGGQFRKADGERALCIDWMSKDELAQAIPPAYSRWIAEQMLPVVLRRREERAA